MILRKALDSILQNKRRNLLPGFGVARGVFIHVFLLGVGSGFQKGAIELFSGFSKNSVWVIGGNRSSTNFYGRGSGSISFSKNILHTIQHRFQNEILEISPESNLSNIFAA